MSYPLQSFFCLSVVVILHCAVDVTGQTAQGLGIRQEDFAFLSHWSSLPVDKLKKYESSAGTEKFLKELTATAFKQKVLSWPLIFKLWRLRSSSGSSSSNLSILPKLSLSPDSLLLAYTAPQILKATNETSELKVTQEVLANVSVKHVSFGQAGVFVDAFLAKSLGKLDQLPPGYLFVLPSETILKDNVVNISGTLPDAEKMFPSQRVALYKRLTTPAKDNIGKFIAQVTSSDVAESMLEVMPPSIFKDNLGDIRDQLNKLNKSDLAKVVYFPKSLLHAWQEDIQATGALSATVPHLSLRGMTCAALQSVETSQILVVLDAYNKNVLREHPDRLKTLPMSLRKCMVESIKKYLKTKATTSSSEMHLLNLLDLDEVAKVGGHVLSGFAPAEIEAIVNPELRREVIRSIGSVPLAELMPLAHIDRLQNFSNIYLKDVATLTEKEFEVLGSLALVMPITKWGVASAEGIRSLVEKTLTRPHQKCICLTKSLSEAFQSALIKGYGGLVTWKASALVALEEMLIVLDEQSWKSLQPEALVSALPYLIQNKTYHDRHYDAFPGFVGPVSFDKACQFWLDIDNDSLAYKVSSLRFSRTLLLASQLAVNLAYTDSNSRVRRQLKSPADMSDELTVKMHTKAVEILVNRYTNNSLSNKQLDDLRAMVAEIESMTMKVILSALGVSSLPTDDLQSAIQAGYASGAITVDELANITQVAKDGQKLYVKRVSEILNLSAKDFDVDETIFCQFSGKACPAPNLSTTTRSPTSTITSGTTSTITSGTTKATISQPLTTSLATSSSPSSTSSSSQTSVAPSSTISSTTKSPVFNLPSIIMTVPSTPISNATTTIATSTTTIAASTTTITTGTSTASTASTMTSSTTATTAPATTSSTPLPLLDVEFGFTFTGFAPTLDLKTTDTLPEKLTCPGLMAAGWAASSVNAQDFESWTSQQIYDCLEVLGSIEWPSRAAAVDVWGAINSKMSFQKASGSTMIFLRNLLEAAMLKSIDILSFNLTEAIEPLSLISTFDLPEETIKAVAEKIVSFNKLNSASDIDVVRLISLKSVICGFPVELVKMLVQSSKDRLGLLHAFGSIKQCHNLKVLEVLADQAQKELPMPWKTSDALSFGIIMAGLSPTDFSNLNNASLSGVTASAIKHLTPEHFRLLTAEKLTAISPESMSVLKISQLPKDGGSILEPSQITALETHVDSSMTLGRMIRQYQLLQHEDDLKKTLLVPANGSPSDAAAVVSAGRTNAATSILSPSHFIFFTLSTSFARFLC